jgi:PRTRC genetic system protein A
MQHPVDNALQTAVPTVMVPRHGDFTELANHGHRFLAASDGLWLEARRSWLYLRWPLARQHTVAMPYGTIQKAIQIARAPRELVSEFIRHAREVCPLECAAWIVWNAETDTWKLVQLTPTTATTSFVSFDRPRLADNEHLVVDLHSHGRINAFFSGQDDTDDRGEYKVAGVFGCFDGEIEARFRLCANGLFIDLGNKWEQ